MHKKITNYLSNATFNNKSVISRGSLATEARLLSWTVSCTNNFFVLRVFQSSSFKARRGQQLTRILRNHGVRTPELAENCTIMPWRDATRPEIRTAPHCFDSCLRAFVRRLISVRFPPHWKPALNLPNALTHDVVQNIKDIRTVAERFCSAKR